MKIVITGLPKSGTTGLYYKLKNSLPESARCHFECRLAPPAAAGTVLVKTLYRADREQIASYAGYDRRIVIVRDPRDRLVSAVLYSCGAHCEYALDGEKVAAMAGLLRRKEAGEAVSLLDVYNLNARLAGRAEAAGATGFAGLAALEESLAGGLPGYHRFRYDDLVDGEFAELEAYLGLALAGTAEVDDEHRRVVRSRRSGGWRHWFTADDVSTFRHLFDPVIAAMGWDPAWDLASEPSLEPRHGSDYFLRLARESADRLSAERDRRASPDFAGAKAEALARIMGEDWAGRRRGAGEGRDDEGD